MNNETNNNGILGWFAENHVAANLLMLFIIIAGLLTIFQVNREIFPEYSMDRIVITVPYRGASPSDVEDGVLLRVEEAISAVEGIKRMYSTAREGSGSVTVEVEEYADTQEVLDDIKSEVDRITTFPEETEEPIIREITNRREVLSIVFYGDVSEKILKELGDRTRNELTAKENISQVEVFGVRPYEISIEFSEEDLRRYGLSFSEISQIISSSSLDIPAGSIETEGTEILLRTKGQKYTGSEFEDIILLTAQDGTEIRLGDIADVRDAFEDVDIYSQFNGKKAVFVKIYRVGNQGVFDIAETVDEYVAQANERLPTGIKAEVWQDRSDMLRSRMNLLQRNALLGGILVFCSLALFLDIQLAFWTTIGMLISFLGAFYLMPTLDLTINMMTLFAFIMSLGLVVDDAIVVGENIFAYREAGYSNVRAAIKGVKEMASPVTIAIITTIFAFLPLLYTTGIMGKILRSMPLIVISVLVVSLVEALLILPAHLSGKTRKKSLVHRIFDPVHQWSEKKLKRFIQGPFASIAETAVKKRYFTFSVAIMIFLASLGLILGGYIKLIFFEPVEADNIIASVKMPLGTPVERTREVVETLEKSINKVRKEVNSARAADKPDIIKHISTTIGSQPSGGGGPGPEEPSGSGGHIAEVNVELLGSEKRDISSTHLMNKWRNDVGEIAGVSSLQFASEIFSAGEPVNVELSHRDFNKLLEASEKLKVRLRDYQGLENISDSFEPGKPELKLSLKPTGRMLGITLGDLAGQVRQGFYGDEIQRIQRGRHDVRVMARYPERQRKSIEDIEQMRFRLADGTEIPFSTVAEIEYGRGYATIERAERRRIVQVTADVDETVANANEINNEIKSKLIPRLKSEYPGLSYRFAGERRELNESLGSLRKNFVIAMLAIYGLLAIQFRSYSQPFIVMSAIPFGIIGATLGHLLMGYDLSILSMFGLVALSGIVVNDSLIIIDLINRSRDRDRPLPLIIKDCSQRRFRPIMLTTLTTCLGLLPMLLETSLQARFLIPMAISLAFGIAFATMITLLLVPSLYLILEDIKSKTANLRE